MAVAARRPFNDANGDGLDDISGLPRREHESGAGLPGDAETRGVEAAGSLETPIFDANGDGRDDNTNLTQEELDAALASAFGYQTYNDADGDGKDDATGLDRERFREQEHLNRGGDGTDPARSFLDEDGDGRDDASGLDEETFGLVQTRANTERTRSGAASTRAREADRATGLPAREAEAAAQAEAQRQAADAAYRAEYEEYVSSGQRAADLAAGRAARPAPGTKGAPGYADPAAQGGAGGGGGEGGLIPGTGIPIVDWLSGNEQQRAAAQAALEKQQRRDDAEGLRNYLWTPDDVSIEYGQLDRIDEAANTTARADTSAIEAQRRALAGFEDIYQQGGLTAADRGRLAQTEREMARGMRSQREADMASLRARGLGGSGASIASMLAAQQSGADMLADREADIAARAEDRAISALGSASDAAGSMRNSSWTENSWNAQNLNEWNKRSAEYLRDHNKYNVGAQDKTNESSADALKDWYTEQKGINAAKEGVYNSTSGESAAATRREDEAKQRQVGMFGEILSGLKDAF
jgi:hypothetical protein